METLLQRQIGIEKKRRGDIEPAGGRGGRAESRTVELIQVDVRLFEKPRVGETADEMALVGVPGEGDRAAGRDRFPRRMDMSAIALQECAQPPSQLILPDGPWNRGGPDIEVEVPDHCNGRRSGAHCSGPATSSTAKGPTSTESCSRPEST